MPPFILEVQQTRARPRQARRDKAQPGTELSVHVVGVERPARVIAPSPYDPEGKAMRG